MSEFVVNYGCIDDVVFIINKDPDDAPRSEEQRIADGTIIGRALIAINQQAVAHRYDEDITEADKLYVKNYEYDEPNGVTGWQKYNSLRCMTYQCCEGPIRDHELYKTMVRYENALEAIFMVAGGHRNSSDGYVWDRPRD